MESENDHYFQIDKRIVLMDLAFLPDSSTGFHLLSFSSGFCLVFGLCMTNPLLLPNVVYVCFLFILPVVPIKKLEEDDSVLTHLTAR